MQKENGANSHDIIHRTSTVRWKQQSILPHKNKSSLEKYMNKVFWLFSVKEGHFDKGFALSNQSKVSG